MPGCRGSCFVHLGRGPPTAVLNDTHSLPDRLAMLLRAVGHVTPKNDDECVGGCFSEAGYAYVQGFFARDVCGVAETGGLVSEENLDKRDVTRFAKEVLPMLKLFFVEAPGEYSLGACQILHIPFGRCFLTLPVSMLAVFYRVSGS